jgi:hypothetical protein
MIYQLSDAQIRNYISTLLSEGTQSLASHSGQFDDMRFHAEESTRRVDPYDAMSLNIYRNTYERRIPEVRPIQCIGRGEDIPGYEDALKELAAQHDKARS